MILSDDDDYLDWRWSYCVSVFTLVSWAENEREIERKWVKIMFQSRILGKRDLENEAAWNEALDSPIDFERHFCSCFSLESSNPQRDSLREEGHSRQMRCEGVFFRLISLSRRRCISCQSLSEKKVKSLSLLHQLMRVSHFFPVFIHVFVDAPRFSQLQSFPPLFLKIRKEDVVWKELTFGLFPLVSSSLVSSVTELKLKDQTMSSSQSLPLTLYVYSLMNGLKTDWWSVHENTLLTFKRRVVSLFLLLLPDAVVHLSLHSFH